MFQGSLSVGKPTLLPISRNPLASSPWPIRAQVQGPPSILEFLHSASQPEPINTSYPAATLSITTFSLLNEKWNSVFRINLGDLNVKEEFLPLSSKSKLIS